MVLSMWIPLPGDSCMWLTGSHSALGKSFNAHPRLSSVGQSSSLIYIIMGSNLLLSCIRLLATPWTVVHGILQARILQWVAFPPSLGDLPNPGIEPRSPALQVDSLPAELTGKPKNTGVGSPVLLQGIFLIQELNQGLLHCRRILYQLGYKEALGSIPGLERSPGEGKGYPLQYSGLENSMDRIVHGVAKSWTRLSDFHFQSAADDK